MTPVQIKDELKKLKITQKQIAQKLGVSEMSVSHVVNKQLVSDRIMRAVAETIGWDYRAVFPEYYFGPKRRVTSKAISEAA